MPTPFMHMAFAERLIADPVLPAGVRDLLVSNWGAFLLGSVAPDARVSSGIDRVGTHFFEYVPHIDPSAVQVMMTRYPELARAGLSEAARRVFIAGYAAHLMMDQIWCTDLLFPIFFEGKWGEQTAQILALHVLLSHTDQRDRRLMPASHYDALASATPAHWLPFIDDSALVVWRDTIASQIAPGAESQTFAILGKRVNMTAEEVVAIVNDVARMNAMIWTNVPPPKLAQTEEAMYSAARSAVIDYLDKPDLDDNSLGEPPMQVKRSRVSEAFANAKRPSIASNEPFRMIIAEIVATKGFGTAVIGRVENGILRKGDAVIISGENMPIIYTHITMFHGFIHSGDLYGAVPGDNVGFSLHEVEVDQLKVGMVITKPPVDS